MINVLYFASVRQRLGRDAETVERAANIRQLLTSLSSVSDKHRALFEEPQGLCFAINQEFARIDDSIPEGAEVAIFPPVTGG